MANKKLSGDLSDVERTEEKIAELQGHLRDARRKQKTDEDIEIVKAIRGRKMTSRELLEFLDGVEEGAVEFIFGEKPVSDNDGGEDQNKQVQETVPESEDSNNGSTEENL